MLLEIVCVFPVGWLRMLVQCCAVTRVVCGVLQRSCDGRTIRKMYTMHAGDRKDTVKLG